jgi:hypothetical protein
MLVVAFAMLGAELLGCGVWKSLLALGYVGVAFALLVRSCAIARSTSQMLWGAVKS